MVGVLFTVHLAKQPAQERPEMPPADIRGVHILVVDDNATNREVLMAQLFSWGVKSEDAPDAFAALKALYLARDAGDPFRIAILDMQMPGMDGCALGRAIKTDETLKGTHLILLSSLGQRGDAKQMEEVGFSACLTKPARQSELFDCLAAVLAGTTPNRQPVVTRHTVRETQRGAARILLAEDNITNQDVAVGIVRNWASARMPWPTAPRAVHALETLPYDLVLMDIQMPEMDGLEATRHIRDVHSSVLDHEVPIVAMTAHALQGDREKCLQAGMNDYVSKPIVPHVLAEALEKWLPEGTAPAVEEKPGKSEAGVSGTAGEAVAPVFDRAGMMARLMGDEGLARRIAEGFLEDIPKQIETLKTYLKEGDVARTQRQAHTIKGASANMGGEAMRAVAFGMEKMAKAGDLDAVMANLPELDAQFDLLKKTMNRSIKQSHTKRRKGA